MSITKAIASFAIIATAASLFAYDSSSYVQDGLIAQWDAIDNAGKGFHDPSATAWKDLAGSYDMTLTAHGAWSGGNSLLCDGVGGCAATYGAVGPTSYQTIEVVYRQTDTLARSGGFIFDAGHAHRLAVSAQDGKSLWFSTDTKLHLFWEEREGSIRSVAATYSTTAANSAISSVVSNGVVIADAVKKGQNWNAGDAKLMVGDRTAGSAGYPFKGEIFAIRLYSGVLTPEQLALNYKVDSVRFKGEKLPDVLEVTASPCPVDCAISPSYAGLDNLSAGDTVSLYAPAVEISVSAGTKAICNGYRLYDGAGRVVDSGAATSFSYTHPGEYRRLEWIFSVSNRVTVVGAGGSYSVSDAWVGYDDTFSFTVTPDEGKAVSRITCSANGKTWNSAIVSERILFPATFTVEYANCFYVSPDGNDSADGRTRAAAKATISSALALADAGDTVMLLPGTYEQEAASISPTKAVTICSEGGRDNTAIRLSRNVVAFSIATAGVALRGITFLSDCSTTVGRVINVTKASTVEDILIRDCKVSASTVLGSGGAQLRNIDIRHVKCSGRMMSGFEIKDATTVVENCSVIACEGDNDAYGCAMYVWSGTARNSLFACNTNKYTNTAGAFVAGGSLENCTVADNVVLGSGTAPGVKRTGGSVVNCLISGNVNRFGPLNWTGDESAFTYNCTVPVPSGAGNILSGSPDFADPANYDYSLKSGNAIDAAVPRTWHATSSDISGNRRVVGSAADIGCYEYSAGALSVSAVPDTAARLGEGSVTLTAFPAGANLSGIAFSWTVKNDSGATVATGVGQTFEHSYPLGRYSVELRAATAGESASWTGEKLFSVVAPTVYVAAGSTPLFPYATEETAAASLAQALGAAVPGATVVVCDGLYDIDANIALNIPVTVKSKNGPGAATLRTVKAIGMLTLANPGAVFDGITLVSDGKGRNCQAARIDSGLFTGCVVSNFYSTGSEIIHLASTAATVSNSFITANRHSGRINLVDLSPGGNLLNCRIVGNEGNNNAYGAAVQIYTGVGLVRNCLIAANTNLSNKASAIGTTSPGAGSLVENCTIVGNHVAGSTSVGAVHVVANLKVRNSIIVGNTNQGGEANWDTTGANITYSCTTPEPCAGAGNIEPSGTLFADEDYRIRAGILTDSGINQPWMDGAFDLDGNSRIYDNGTVDIGCYEYVPASLEVSAAPSATVRVGEGDVTLSAVASAATESLEFVWSVSNQRGEVVASATGTGLSSFTRSYPVGVYSVSLVVFSGSTTATFSQDALFAVKPETIYVATEAEPAFPYDTKAAAFRNVDDAIGFAENGMRIVVTDGIYTNQTNPAIAKDIVIESENGPSRTKVYAENDTVAWTINSPGAVVRGLTLFSDYGAKRFSNESRRNNAISVVRGLLADCVVSNWYSYYTYVFNVGGGTSAGIVSNCLITSSMVSYRASLISISGQGLLVNSRVVGNLADSASNAYGSVIAFEGSGVLRGSLVADNTTKRTRVADIHYGSVVDMRTGASCYVENCTIVSNTATASDTCALGNSVKGQAGSLVLRNTILWHNSNATGVLDWQGSDQVFENCNSSTPGLDPAQGNISADPGFYALKSKPAYMPMDKSPCQNAGRLLPWMDGAVDLFGAQRLLYGRPDIGCYEIRRASGTALIFW